jgi:hypothetical protein
MVFSSEGKGKRTYSPVARLRGVIFTGRDKLKL